MIANECVNASLTRPRNDAFQINMRCYLMVAMSILALGGCLRNQPCPDMKFERFMQSDRIVVTDNMSKEIKTITDRTTIEQITNFAISHSAGWATPWYDTPIAQLQANFYAGTEFIGNLGVGNNFLTTQSCVVSVKDRKTIVALLVVKDPYETR